MILGDLDTREIDLVTVHVDMRKGYNKLASYASAALDIDITEERNYVLFINSHAKALKLIGQCGNIRLLINIKLDKGSFQRVQQRTHEPSYIKLTKQEFLNYIQGYQIMTCRAI